MPAESGYGDLLEAAVLSKRAGDFQAAHRLFEDVYERAHDDPEVVREFRRWRAERGGGAGGDP